MKVAWAFTLIAHRWLAARHDAVAAGADALVREALAIVLHDCTLITVKLSRALDGYDRCRHDGNEEDHPVQNDWNGTAKVALISMTRSEAAWRALDIPLDLHYEDASGRPVSIVGAGRPIGELG